MLSPIFAVQGMLRIMFPSTVWAVHLPSSTYTTFIFSVTMVGIKFQNGNTKVVITIMAAAMAPTAINFSFMHFDPVYPLFSAIESIVLKLGNYLCLLLDLRI